MYEIHLPAMLKLTSALMGVVMNVAEKSKFSKKIRNLDKMCSEWHETDCASIKKNVVFFKIFFEKNFEPLVIFGKFDFFRFWSTFWTALTIFPKQDFDMELFRIARPYIRCMELIIYNHSLKLTSVLIRWRHQSGWKLKKSRCFLVFWL